MTAYIDKIIRSGITYPIKDAGAIEKNQGAANAGKALVVGSDGNVTLGDAGVPENVATALLDLFSHTAFLDGDVGELYGALYHAIYPTAPVESISAVVHQGYNPICTTDDLETLRPYLTVTAEYGSSVRAVVEDYTISGTLTAGTATVTVGYAGKTATAQVAVTQLPNGYTHRSCVIADGTQYINSGLSEVDVKNFGVAHKVARDSTNVAGMHILSSTNYFIPFYKLNSEANLAFLTGNRYGNQDHTLTDGIARSIKPGRAYELEAFMNGGDIITIDGIDCSIWPAGTTTPSTANKLTFFTYGGSTGSTNYRFAGKFYYLKLFNGSTVVHDYIPCTNSNNVAGLYDAVAGSFLAPATGTLSWE